MATRNIVSSAACETHDKSTVCSIYDGNAKYQLASMLTKLSKTGKKEMCCDYKQQMRANASSV